MLLDNINARDDLPRSGTRANIIEQNLTPALSESSPEEGRNVGEAVPRAGAARFVCSFFLIATAEYRFNGWEWEQPQGRTVNKNIVHPVGNLSAVHPPGRGGQCFRCRARSWRATRRTGAIARRWGWVPRRGTLPLHVSAPGRAQPLPALSRAGC
jgi:hypothetical protein